ncbi:MAG: bifunctional folylpolyglutamate synthase/dihydrofolate synthase [Phycisphaerales bacterium JB037]
MPKATTRSARSRSGGSQSPQQSKPAGTTPKRTARSRPAFSSFAEALEFLDHRVNFEKVRPTQVDPAEFKLDRMRALLDKLDNPERDSRFVHVAGSKGKGSVVEMLASSLGACGYAVGVFTSPHLVDVRERVRIGPTWIDEESFVSLLARTAEADASLPAKLGRSTFFELITAVGLLYFAQQAVDLAVMEVGLGGRLDSTNVIMPEVCALTAIQLEHTAILGDTLAKIAFEKAGIMKPGVPAITVPQPPEVLEVFKSRAEEVQAPLHVLGESIDFTDRFESSPDLGPHVRVCVSGPGGGYEHLAVPLQGHHQAANCGLSLAVLDMLRTRGFDAPERDVAIGLAATPRLGRLEQIWESPRIFVDGAHTPESLEALIKSIGSHIRYDSMVLVFGCAADKNIDAMLDRVAMGADKVIFTKAADNPRAAKPEDLQRRFLNRCSKMTQIEPTLKDALNTAYRAVGRGDLICVTGSFYLAGEAKRLLSAAAAKREG